MGIRTWKKVRPLLDLGDHLGVVLSNGAIAFVDHCDRVIVESWNWTAYTSNSGSVYARRGGCPLHVAIAGRRSDHASGDTLDNRRSNLRPANSEQNARNRRISSLNKTGFKGVSVRADRETYLAAIRVGDKLIKLGTFSAAHEAARRYDAAARELFGVFATLNFPNAGERSAIHGRIE